MQATPRSQKNDPHVSWNRQKPDCLSSLAKFDLEQRTTQSGTHLGRIHHSASSQPARSDHYVGMEKEFRRCLER